MGSGGGVEAGRIQPGGISSRLHLSGGKRFETRETEGIMNFIADMWTTGAGSMDEDDIARKVEDMGGRLDGFSGYDSTGLSASFFSRFLDDGLKLMAEIYAKPTFPEDKLERRAKADRQPYQDRAGSPRALCHQTSERSPLYPSSLRIR